MKDISQFLRLCEQCVSDIVQARESLESVIEQAHDLDPPTDALRSVLKEFALRIKHALQRLQSVEGDTGDYARRLQEVIAMSETVSKI